MGGAAYGEAPAVASGYAAAEAYAGSDLYAGAEMAAAEAYGTGYDMPAVDGYAAAAEMPAGGEAYGEYAAAGYGVEAYLGDGYAAADYAEGATEYNGMLPATSGGPAYPEASGAWDQPALAMPSGGANYTVQVGDNLSQVAAAYGVSVSQLMQANGLQNPNIIYVGQLLIIP
jgi:nucleoid-associated protein YgaU